MNLSSGAESFLASRSDRFYLLFLAAVCAVTLFWGLGRDGLDSLQELRVAEVAREMVASGDYVRPHFLGGYRFQKPPLAYWVCAASFRAAGSFGEFAARAPFAAASFATVVMLFLFMSRAFNGRAAFFASLFLLGAHKYVEHARSCRIDALLVFFMLLCAVLFCRGWRGRNGWFHVAAWAAAGMAFLTKGLPALLFAAVVLPVSIVLARDREGLRRFMLWSLPGFFVFGLLSSAWYIAMLIFDPEAWQIMRRELSVLVDSSRHANNVFYYFYQLFGSLFPAFAFFVPAAAAGWKERSRNPEACLMFSWFGVFLAVLSAMTNKQPHYSLLLVVPVAGLSGWYVDRMLSAAPLPRWIRRWTDAAFYLCAAGTAVAAAAANLGFTLGYFDYEPFGWGLAAALAVFSGLAVWAYWRKFLALAFVMLFASSAFVCVPLNMSLRFRDVKDTSLRTFWSEAAPLVPAEAALYHYAPLSVYVTYYMRACPPTFGSEAELKELLGRHGAVYVMYNSMEPMPDYAFARKDVLLAEKFSHRGKYYYLVRLSLKD